MKMTISSQHPVPTLKQNWNHNNRSWQEEHLHSFNTFNLTSHGSHAITDPEVNLHLCSATMPWKNMGHEAQTPNILNYSTWKVSGQIYTMVTTPSGQKFTTAHCITERVNPRANLTTAVEVLAQQQTLVIQLKASCFAQLSWLIIDDKTLRSIHWNRF